MMNLKIFNTKGYVLNKKTSLNIRLFILFLIIFSALFLLIFFRYEFYKEKKITGVYNEGIYIYLQEDDLINVLDYEIYFNDTKINFEIGIGNEVMISNELYFECALISDIDSKYKIPNNIFTFILRMEKTTLFKEMKGWFI